MTIGTGILEGRTALVTGGGNGVGRGIALALAGEGASVVVAGRTAATLEGTRQLIEDRGGRAAVAVCDITVSEEVDACIAATLGLFGGIDVLVNNAALVPHGSLLEASEELVDAAWAAGPVATWRLMRRCHPHLRDGGVVVNVSSGISKAGSAPNRFAYAMVKSALDALSRAAATEWAADGIRVNTIMPLARTEAVEAWFAAEPEHASAVEAQVPLGRIGDPERDIGRAVVFLVGPDSAYLTGATLPLDGGSAYLR
ncbi:SDR family NAD(P)-dependent oxidoreductase [Trujillonella endophytica]|uniref:NAD(P)-dependent dehydrogenase, short-chain alcohol dehydrogenase family n=1 Tax=Trujillonella endophytica TaxID=673521 RepID=A0A1H8VYD5_9ACTN|nr:SDR family oxidoreductase [Trujillella endophytica]SEP20355.1 NAD(P)-dependent dehydrogenase, short-chain alcohol dehydrogenase family [Trujillella endophytica]